MARISIFKAMIPDITVKKVTDIPFDELKAKGIDTVLLDFDNTLGPDHATEPDEYGYEVIRMLKSKGFKLCLVSNAKSGRSSGIAKLLDIPCVTYAHKPRPDGINRALKLVDSKPEKALMAGDQVFTDVMAGRYAGVYTVFVERYRPKEIWYVALKRPLEKIVRLAGKF